VEAYLSWKNVVKGEKAWPTGCLYSHRRERELGAGPSGWHRTLTSSRTGEPSACTGFPCSWAVDGWASVSVLKVARV
jgi:hypothetical protein